MSKAADRSNKSKITAKNTEIARCLIKNKKLANTLMVFNNRSDDDDLYHKKKRAGDIRQLGFAILNKLNVLHFT